MCIFPFILFTVSPEKNFTSIVTLMIRCAAVLWLIFMFYSNCYHYLYILGMDISPIDLINIQRFASRVIGLVKYRSELSEYLSQRMTNVAPNLTMLIGEQVYVVFKTDIYICPSSGSDPF